jgi:outer membrane biogenesis lipoprotein LolB
MRFLMLLALLAGACAQLETKAPQDVEFDLSGRLAARYGNEAFSGNIAWRHARSADELLITSSLGAGVARLVDADGRLRVLEERGWKIEYQEYEGKLPSRLRLTYPDIELRVAISQWK